MTKPTTPTPLCDAEAFDTDGRCWTTPGKDMPYVSAAFARTLELRLAELTALLREARKVVSDNPPWHEKDCNGLPCHCGAEQVSTLRARIDSALEGK